MCIGDTQWVHEPCLLTWIVRKQSDSGEERVLLAGQENDYLPQNHDLSNSTQKLEFLRHNQYLIKCPQCAIPYRLSMNQPSLFMRIVDLLSSLQDKLLPFVSILGAAYF